MIVRRLWNGSRGRFGRPVFFKRWSPLFDASKEKVGEFPVWVRAPNLPPFLWADSVFKSIGNLLGTFLDADRSYLHTYEKAVARILVRLNPTDGLAKSITLRYKEYVIEQPLDYELLPFRCHRCHEYGHLVRDCPMRRRRRRTQSREEETEGSWRHEVKPMAGSAPNGISSEEPLHQSAEEQPQEDGKDGIPVRPSDVQPNLEPPHADPVVSSLLKLNYPGQQ